ncbi:MAG: DNA primase [Patescibacteria group bacterium]
MDAAQEVKSRLDVVDIVGEYLQLKPAGSGSFKACCPFHQEKTPSFMVNRPRQSWHCFGCDEGGDLISFVQKMEGLDFPEALHLLAEKAGVKLPEFDAKASSERKRIFEVNDLAARFFRSALMNSAAAAHAREYVARRGLDDLTVDVWRLGYAPESWDALALALKSKDVKDEELIKAGLANKGERGGVYDRFRNRLMFPIADVHGNIAGFTGRVLSADKNEAKYVNTPETLVYKKSSILYGLDKAKGEIKKQDMCVIVEGNMDVVGSHQFNITNVVASSGTALTLEQLTLIKRFTQNLAIAFDADAAGNAATVRGLDLARSQDLNLKLITLPPEAGKDPDDAVRKNPELWKQAIRDALPIMDWLYRNAFRGHAADKPEEKKLIARDILSEIKRLPDPVERDAWLTRLARDLAVSDDSLREAMKMSRTNVEYRRSNIEDKKSAAESRHSTFDIRHSREDDLLDRIHAILYLKPELSTLAEKLLQEYYQPILQTDERLDYLALLADREFGDQSLETLKHVLDNACQALRESLMAQKRGVLEQAMRLAEIAGDQNKISQLLEEFSKLTNSAD